jgi:hypothetical protein
MKIEDLISGLAKEETLNENLSTLGSILVELDERLRDSLVFTIKRPDIILNTGRFSSILVKLNCKEFISPLAITIEASGNLQQTWLADYLYALGSILDDADDYFHFSEDFIHMLGYWIEESSTEISWKSSVILSNIDSPLCHDYYVRGVRNTTLFHQTRIACLNGLVNHYGTREMPLYRELLQDDDQVFREAVQEAIQYLEDA